MTVLIASIMGLSDVLRLLAATGCRGGVGVAAGAIARFIEFGAAVLMWRATCCGGSTDSALTVC